MGGIRVAVMAIVTLLAIAGVVAAFVGLSAVVLWGAGRILPLAGRGRRRE
jgi:hypothetical protein